MANMRSSGERRGARVHTLYRPDGMRCSYAWLIFLASLLLAGCATSRPSASGSRHFIFEQDTFAYANRLVWEYHFDEHGKWTHRSREPKSDYTHRCFIVARSAKQFFQNARFEPALPKPDSATYRGEIRALVSTSPRKRLPEAKKLSSPATQPSGR